MPRIFTEEVTLEINWSNLPKGEPKYEETDCACGGKLRYGLWSFLSEVNGERIFIPAVYHYCCKNCGHKLFLPEVSNEIQERIEVARKQNTKGGKSEAEDTGYLRSS